MTGALAGIERRLAKIEATHGLRGDIRQMTDAQLMAVIRRACADLRARHGSLPAAAAALRATGDAALATLIEEEIEGHDAAIH